MTSAEHVAPLAGSGAGRGERASRGELPGRSGGSGGSGGVGGVGPCDWISRGIATALLHGPRLSPARVAQRFLCGHVTDLGGQRFGVNTPDGLRLAAVRFPGRAVDQPRLPVVFLHGWMQVKECQLRMARVFVARGHDVVLFDSRAHGRSQGRHTTFGVRERDDLAAVLDKMAARGWADGRVITAGVSMGAATALMHAADDHRVAGVVAFAPFASLREAVRSYRRRYAPCLSNAWGVRGFEQATDRLGFALDEAAPITGIARIDAPVLILVGQRDKNLSERDHARVLAAARSAERCQVHVVPGANHFNICRKPWPGMDDAVTAFCSRVSEAGAM
jgi:uncharacterized protein